MKGNGIKIDLTVTVCSTTKTYPVSKEGSTANILKISKTSGSNTKDTSEMTKNKDRELSSWRTDSSSVDDSKRTCLMEKDSLEICGEK